MQKSWQTLGVSHAVEIVHVLKDLTLKRYLFIHIYPLRELIRVLIQTLIKSSGITDKRIPKSSSPSVNIDGSLCHQTTASAGLPWQELKRTKRVQRIHFFIINKRNSCYYYTQLKPRPFFLISLRKSVCMNTPQMRVLI